LAGSVLVFISIDMCGLRRENISIYTLQNYSNNTDSIDYNHFHFYKIVIFSSELVYWSSIKYMKKEHIYLYFTELF